MDLAVGDNALIIEATDPSGARGRARITVTRVPDTTRPAILGTTPASDAVGVAVDAPLTVRFSEAMDPATVNAETITLLRWPNVKVAGSVSYESNGSATFTPSAPLASGTRYLASVETGARDLAGNGLAARHVWAFTTAGPPAQIETSPPVVYASTPADGQRCVPVETVTSASFSEEILGTSLDASTWSLRDASGVPVAGTFRDDGIPTAFTTYFVPTASLAPGTSYVATLTQDITDLVGNPLLQSRSWRFDTQTAGDGTWTAPSSVGAPTAQGGRTAIWTGTRMIVWGGDRGDGASYEPATDRWSALSGTGAPSPRAGHAAVWTGNRMIVWGGLAAGASGPEAYLDSGAIYDPATDTWRPMSTQGAPSPRTAPSAVWTGSEMIVWGGLDYYSTYPVAGARYDPASDTWSPMSTRGAPSGRDLHTAIWTGTAMVVWGGRNRLWGVYNGGGLYSPATDSWSDVEGLGAPSPRMSHTAVWTGDEMIVWGGKGSGSFYEASGARYRVATRTWTPIAADCAPIGQGGHLAVWTGSEMLIGGGAIDFGRTTRGGGRYDPVTDSWRALPARADPVPAVWEAGVWTGSSLIVWDRNGGGRYQPQ